MKKQTDVILPTFLKPTAGAPLVRLGRENDGGYLVDKRNIGAADMLIGMGINDDWSFEEAFHTQNPVRIHAYDASVSAWDFFLAAYVKIALFEPINAWNAIKTLSSFKRFFDQKNRIHHREFIDVDDNARRISLTTLLERDVPIENRNLFFKIDIEGSEYKLLDTLIACADRIEGMVIEFHNIDRNMGRIKRFLSDFPLTLCHVHANNCGAALDDGTPIVIECSFTRQPVEGAHPLTLPHPLDSPCWPGDPEMAIKFPSAQESAGI